MESQRTSETEPQLIKALQIIKLRLSKAITTNDWETCLRIVGQLDSFSLGISELEISGIGKTVRTLTKTVNQTLAHRAELLLLRWSKCVKRALDSKKTMKKLQAIEPHDSMNKELTNFKEESGDDFLNCKKKCSTLAKLCVNVVLKNRKSIGKLSRVPLKELKPLFNSCTRENLAHLEKLNPEIIWFTDSYWKKFCRPPYPKEKPKIGWREFCLRQEKEFSQKLEVCEFRLKERYQKIESEKRKRRIIYMDKPAPEKRKKVIMNLRRKYKRNRK
ncbi:uncharacterized protein LOC135142481 [Zophobas morio]|uniref:uncharacterized protein LOC135142481 n=1 Tax=Zophobas morio TaxID=2755281 RepID=UPI003083CA1D